jgi:hypothetical protein
MNVSWPQRQYDMWFLGSRIPRTEDNVVAELEVQCCSPEPAACLERRITDLREMLGRVEAGRVVDIRVLERKVAEGNIVRASRMHQLRQPRACCHDRQQRQPALGPEVHRVDPESGSTLRLL